jgi:hypothetical protein
MFGYYNYNTPYRLSRIRHEIIHKGTGLSLNLQNSIVQS